MESQNLIEPVHEPTKEELKFIVPYMKYIINEMNYFRHDDPMYIFWRNILNAYKAKYRLNRIPHLADA